MKAREMAAALACALLISACGGGLAKRGENKYRSDTRALLTAQNSEVQQCYDKALSQDPAAAGVVVVDFTVKAKTGAIVDSAIDKAETTAPASLSDCILATVNGLSLAPADKNDGRASFRWEFAPGG